MRTIFEKGPNKVMATTILPDRERRHLLQFHFWPSLTYGRRLGIAAAFVLAGLSAQFAFNPAIRSDICYLAVIPILIGNLFLLVRGYDLQPKIPQVEDTWEETTLEKLSALREMERSVRRWDDTFFDISCTLGFFSLILAGIVVGLLAVALYSSEDFASWGPVFVLDASALILPHWLSGLRRGWRPVQLTQQAAALEEAVGVLQARISPQMELKPMFQMGGQGKERCPISARLFVRFPQAPESFIGVQFQVAINDVQGTKFPYFYGVIIAKPSMKIDTAPARSAIPSSLVVKIDRQPDVDVMVIRQETTRNAGYHTRPDMIRTITTAVVDAAQAQYSRQAVPD